MIARLTFMTPLTLAAVLIASAIAALRDPDDLDESLHGVQSNQSPRRE